MKRKYVKPWISIDSFEVKSCILEMSYGGVSGEDDPKESEARNRFDYDYKMSNGENIQRNYGSYGKRNPGWGSLW